MPPGSCAADDEAMTIGDRIRLRRAVLGITEDELAHRMEVSRSAVNQWEQGGTTPRQKKMDRLAQALDTDVLFLWTGRESADASLEDKQVTTLLRLFSGLPPEFRARALSYVEGLTAALKPPRRR
jgi:transcriptional regulator with XRE-family HTH domain